MLLENKAKVDKQKSGWKTSSKTSNYGTYNLKMPWPATKTESHGDSYYRQPHRHRDDGREKRRRRRLRWKKKKKISAQTKVVAWKLIPFGTF